MNSKSYEESEYGLDLDLLTISYQLQISYPRRSGLVEKNSHLRPIYLTFHKLACEHQTSDHVTWRKTRWWELKVRHVTPRTRGHTTNTPVSYKGHFHTRAKSRDHVIVRAQKKVCKGRPKTPPKPCSVVTVPKVFCEAICDHALNQMLSQRIPIHASPYPR